jgi:hypothetical protein
MLLQGCRSYKPNQYYYGGTRNVVLERDELNNSIEIDPNKLTLNEAGTALGFEKPSGFEEMTNFGVEVAGYVGDGKGTVVGYILKINPAVVDPQHTNTEDVAK